MRACAVGSTPQPLYARRRGGCTSMVADEHAVEIVEVGPRDGLQSEPGVLPTATKVEFIERAIAAGVRRLEVTSFVNPKRVPQMADAEAVLQALPRRDDVLLHRPRAQPQGLRARGGRRLQRDRHGRRGQRHLQPAQPGRDDRGVDRRLAGDRARPRRPPASARRSRSPPRSAARSRARCRRRASSRSPDAWRRPRPFEIALADTIGVGVPAQVTELVGRVREALPGHPVALPLPQHPQHRARQCLRRGAGGRDHARREPRRHRRLPVCAGGDRQHPDRRPRLHAASLRLRDRRLARRTRSRPGSGCRSSSGGPCRACWSRPAPFRGRAAHAA